jgi:CRP-like cAMP-binding protein
VTKSRAAQRLSTRTKAATVAEFSAQAFLDSVGVAKTVVRYGRDEAIFAQGDVCEDVMYIQSGGVKLSVLSKTGKEAVVAMLGPGDFFGEGCLAGQPLRMGSATAITPERDPPRRQRADGASAAPRACYVRPVHRAHAHAQHPD